MVKNLNEIIKKNYEKALKKGQTVSNGAVYFKSIFLKNLIGWGSDATAIWTNEYEIYSMLNGDISAKINN